MAKVITEQARALVGKDSPPFSIEVDRSELRKFAAAVAFPAPPNPLYGDEKYARHARFGGLIAHPTFCTSFRWLGGPLEALTPILPAYRVGMNGGNEYEFLEPIRPGDVLTGRARIASLEEKPRDDGGVMLVVSLEASFFNQFEEKVLIARQTLLRIYGPENLAASGGKP